MKQPKRYIKTKQARNRRKATAADKIARYKEKQKLFNLESRLIEMTDLVMQLKDALEKRREEEEEQSR